MSRLGETWKQQYLAEGRAKAEAKALILLADQRFGPRRRLARWIPAPTRQILLTQSRSFPCNPPP
jgi:hypothetical protein